MQRKQYGTRFGGNEEDFENLFSNYVKNLSQDKNFTYLEVGVDEGKTFKCIVDIVKEKKIYNNYFVAIDITDIAKPIWRNNFGEINLIYGREINLLKDVPNFIICDANLILKNSWNKEIDICFIDACHGYECVKSNFLNVEKFIKIGGYVIFHDAGIPEQNTDYQPHCGENINVRKAIADLGLIENKNPKWFFIKETNGTRKIGLNGNSSIIIQKIVNE